jgi:AcrR family transcriptional regulator
MAGKATVAESSSRPYRSPLRERQVAQTREAILHAVAEEILEHGIHGLAMSAVAARADIAERTVYRYFANIDALLEGLSQYVGEQLTPRLGDGPRLKEGINPSPEELINHLPRLYRALDEIGTPARAVAAITLIRGSDAGRRRRQELLGRYLADEMAHLPDEEARALLETMYMLAGSVSWFLVTTNTAITGEQAGRAAARMMHAVLADLRREREAAAQ